MPKFIWQPPAAFDCAILFAGGEVDEYHICLGYYGDELNPDDFGVKQSITSVRSSRDLKTLYRGPD